MVTLITFRDENAFAKLPITEILSEKLVGLVY
jgi:hypothetical protein